MTSTSDLIIFFVHGRGRHFEECRHEAVETRLRPAASAAERPTAAPCSLRETLNDCGYHNFVDGNFSAAQLASLIEDRLPRKTAILLPHEWLKNNEQSLTSLESKENNCDDDGNALTGERPADPRLSPKDIQHLATLIRRRPCVLSVSLYFCTDSVTHGSHPTDIRGERCDTYDNLFTSAVDLCMDFEGGLDASLPCFRCLSQLDLTEKSRNALARTLSCADTFLRPDWQLYFMRLAFLAGSRSNCRKRRVGAIVVSDDNRVLATGYNGTPSSALNCRDGGCRRCADSRVAQGQDLEQCLCLHAESNAVLEIGRKKCANSTIYVTCKPCLSCAKMLCQVSVRCVIYYDDYASSYTQTAPASTITGIVSKAGANGLKTGPANVLSTSSGDVAKPSKCAAPIHTAEELFGLCGVVLVRYRPPHPQLLSAVSHFFPEEPQEL